MAKNLPAVQETWVQSLGREDTLEKGMAMHSSILSGEFHAQRSLEGYRFPRQEYWNGLPFPSPGDIPDPGIEPKSPALADGFFTAEPSGKPPSPG